MNCEDFQEAVVQGQGKTSAAVEHLQTCSACEQFASALDNFTDEPDTQHLRFIKDRISHETSRVRPLPSNERMMIWGILLFSIFSVLIALPFGHRGFDRLSQQQRWLYVAVILIAALLLCSETIQQLIPGTRRLWNRWVPPAIALGSLVTLTCFLFDTRGLAGDVPHGVPCLVLGLFSASIGGVLSYLLVRNGYPVSPRMSGLVTGLFSGLAGVTVLAIHCPLLEAGHIIVWHLGSMVLAGACGAVLGRLFASR
jgi:hypothetical protein